MTVVLENTNYEDALRQPFLASLARRGALLTHFTAEAHPSQPNYIALISGSTLGVTSDGNVSLDERHVGDLLEANGLHWKVYAEGYPGNCFLGAAAGAYVRKHVPFLSFKNVQNDRARCARIVNASELASDVRDGTLPEYSLYVPDLKNDGHDTGVAYADRWLSATFGPLLQDPRFTKDLLFIVTFDESKGYIFGGNHVATILLGEAVAPGTILDAHYDHYGLLRLVEDGFGLGSLGQGDAHAAVITGWKK
jgi:phospholipase C